MNSFRPGYNCKNYRQTNFAPCVARIECLLETAHVGQEVWFNQFQHYTSQPREKPNSTKSKTLPFSGLRCTFDSVRRRPTPARLCSDASSHRTRQNKKKPVVEPASSAYATHYRSVSGRLSWSAAATFTLDEPLGNLREARLALHNNSASLLRTAFGYVICGLRKTKQP